MKYDCDKRKRERCQYELERYEKGTTEETVFLWFPRQITAHDCRWLERVKRIRTYSGIFKERLSSAREAFNRKDYDICLSNLREAVSSYPIPRFYDRYIPLEQGST